MDTDTDMVGALENAATGFTDATQSTINHEPMDRARIFNYDKERQL